MTGTDAPRSALSLTLSSLFWTILLPGVVAGYVPWEFFGVRDTVLDRSSPFQWLALLFILAGGALLLACIVEFARSGRGTLSPIDPPKQLVVRGLYRYVRNPMYLSVTAILLGEVLLTGSRALAIYWLIWFVVVNAFVVGYEEPTLRLQFGGSYEEYLRTVDRWIPRIHRRHSGTQDQRLR